MAKPKPAPTRVLGNELGKIDTEAANAFASRNPALLEALLGNISGISPALTSARTGEMDSLADWLKGDGRLKTSNQRVQTATRTATRPTYLQGVLNTTADAALRDPTSGNAVLQDLVKTRGPSRLLSTLTDQAQTGLEANGQLSPEEEMQVTQSARAAMASRGFNGGSPAVLAEVLGREQYVQNRQDRARSFASGVEGLDQSSRGQDLVLANAVQGATDSARTFGLNVNAQDMSKQAFDLSAKTAAADYRLKTDPKLMAYSTPSMVPGDLSAASTTASQADVYPNILQYGADVNNTNTNMLESRYLNYMNAQYANSAGAQQANAAKDAANATTTSAVVGGVAVVAAAAAVCWLAREVFGPESGEWMRYREWLHTAAPARWFRRYHRHAKRWAALCRTSTRARMAFTKLLINQLNHGGNGHVCAGY